MQPSFATKGAVGRSGDIIQIALPVGAALYSFGEKDNQGLKQMLFSGLASTAITHALKYSVNEKRPNGGKHSFPSGHTSISFAASTYMWKRYGYEYGLPMTLLAGYVGYSRVETRAHFIHDVVVGAIIGVGTSVFFTTPYDANLQITPNGVTFTANL